MRNLKKILALALALVMTLSLMTVANAFNDDKDVNSTYAEAVEVLSGLGVFKGVNDGSNFAPKQTITRAEVAAIIYRIVTGDVADRQDGIYADYAKFKDVAANHWAAGYIGYCSNAELIVGDGTNFYPDQTVNGYQALAMILRAMGYDQNDEFKGEGWEIRVASTAQQKGVLKNVNAGTLGVAATRELVAELLFQAISGTNTVFYLTNTMSYMDEGSTLGYQTFGLAKGNRTTIDNWGRPGYTWTATKNSLKMPTVATVEEAPVATYTTAVTECDVADDTNRPGDTTYALYVNGNTVRSNYMVNALDTVTKIGAQGRLTEVYADRIVMIDTFLARVVSVSDAAYDAAGHLKTPATITLSVYDSTVGGNTYVLTNGANNWGYVVGDMVLLNAYTATGTATDTTTTVSKKGVTNNGLYGEIVGKATSLVGAQTIIYTNATQHNVNGTIYNDACKFLLDEAGVSTANFNWYFDQYNNLIGATEIAAATSYGVITSIWWAGNTTDGSGLANATVTYMDGTTGTVTLSSMTVNTANVGNPYVAATGRPTYSIATTDIMSVNNSTQQFWVTTDAATNARAEANTATYTGATNGIIGGHLFQFTTQANGTVAAMEVGGTTTDGVAKLASVNTAVSKDTLYSNLITSNTTMFLIKSGAGFITITGVNNIGSYQAAEVDYVDLNNDGVADYVYVIGQAVNAVADSLFYYAGGQISYDVATQVYTVPGYVDGVAGELKITYANATFYNTIVTGGANKLYKVTNTNGYVSALSAITTNGQVTFANSNTYGSYASNLWVTPVTGAAGHTHKNGVYNIPGWGSVVENGNTKVVGSWADDMSQKDVILVWHSASGSVENGLILQAYIVDKSGNVPGITTINSADMAATQPVTGRQLGAITCTTNGIVGYNAQWFDATSGQVVPSTQIALAGHVYVCQVSGFTAAYGYELAPTFGVNGWNSTVPGTWTWTWTATT